MHIPKFPGCGKAITSLESKGMTQMQISSQTGIKQSTIANLKAGRKKSTSAERGITLFALYAHVVLGRKLAIVPKEKRT